MSVQNEILYQEREKRVLDTVSLKKPDRVPFVTLSSFYFVTSQGVSCRDMLYDYDKVADAFKKTQRELNSDMTGQYHFMSGKVLDILGIRTFSWPGAADPDYRLKDNLLFQYREEEYMTGDEFDEFFRDPTDFTIRKLFPRMATALKPLEAVPSSPVLFGSGYSLIGAFPLIAGLFSGVGQTVIEASVELGKWQAKVKKLGEDLKEMGYPTLNTATINCPFDWVSGYLRGMKGTMLDMYRQPEKLLGLIEFFEPHLIEAAVIIASMGGNNRVYIPLHRGADGFMSDEQFKKFYWPQLKQFCLALVERGLLPIPHFEGDYTSRLKYIAELPAGSVMGHYDRIDRKKHKELLSDTMCFWGDIPPSLLVSGNPEGVKDFVKELIDFFPDGGLIIDGSAAGIPVEAKKENVQAIAETVFEYGKY